MLIIVFGNHFAFHVAFPYRNLTTHCFIIVIRNIAGSFFNKALRNIADAFFIIFLGYPSAFFYFPIFFHIFTAVDFAVAWFIADTQAIAVSG